MNIAQELRQNALVYRRLAGEPANPPAPPSAGMGRPAPAARAPAREPEAFPPERREPWAGHPAEPAFPRREASGRREEAGEPAPIREVIHDIRYPEPSPGGEAAPGPADAAGELLVRMERQARLESQPMEVL